MVSPSGHVKTLHANYDRSDIRIIKAKQQYALVDQTDFPDFSFELVDADFLEQQQWLLGTSEGRGTVWFLRNPNPQSDKEYVLRTYLRGGFIRHFLHDQYFHLSFQTSRAWREFELLQELYIQGLPVPRPVIAVVKRSGIIYRSFIVTERISGAQDLHQHLMQKPISRAVWQRIGLVIGQMHHLAVYHHDLNLRNILLDGDNKAWLIDFDKCCTRKPGTWEEGNLERLKRSFNKAKSLQPNLHWQPENFEQLLVGYIKGRQS